jgi:hypothetical protein
LFDVVGLGGFRVWYWTLAPFRNLATEVTDASITTQQAHVSQRQTGS